MFCLFRVKRIPRNINNSPGYKIQHCGRKIIRHNPHHFRMMVFGEGAYDQLKWHIFIMIFRQEDVFHQKLLLQFPVIGNNRPSYLSVVHHFNLIRICFNNNLLFDFLCWCQHSILFGKSFSKYCISSYLLKTFKFFIGIFNFPGDKCF